MKTPLPDSEFNGPAWEVPAYREEFWIGKKKEFCIVIPVINEGNRIKNLLIRMKGLQIPQDADVILVDGGSQDGSLDVEFLKSVDVRALLLKTGEGKLSAQLRCAYAFALQKGYAGIVTIDGNDKDDPVSINSFLDALRGGVDFVQASRFIPGGVAVNTPASRHYAIKFVHAPLLSVFSGFKWTDTTQGFRAYSSRMLLDPRLSIFRSVFRGYELLAYMSYRAPRLGYACVELPSKRRYPQGDVPTKISLLRGNFSVLKVLLLACIGFYNP